MITYIIDPRNIVALGVGICCYALVCGGVCWHASFSASLLVGEFNELIM